MSWAVKFRDELNSVSTWITEELDGLIAQISSTFDVEHDAAGHHTNITGTSISLTGAAAFGGALTVGGSGTFVGDVTARSTVSPVTIGSNAIGAAVSGSGIRMRDAPTAVNNDWAWISGNAGVSRQLSLRDVLEVGDTDMLKIKRTAASSYSFLPGSSAVTLALGTDATGQRWAEVNSLLVQTRAVKFPATQIASSDVNTLDDYEEGTWTPVLAFGGASVGITYSIQFATYIKIGQLVHVEFELYLTNKGSSVGVATITGAPFTFNAVPSNGLDFTVITGGTSKSAYMVASTVTIFPLYYDAVAARLQFADTDFANTSALQGSLTYRTNA